MAVCFLAVIPTMTSDNIDNENNSNCTDNGINCPGVDNSNCSETNSTCTGIFVTEGRPILATIAFSSILLNIVIMLNIHSMAKQKLTPTRNLFLLLAFSDLCVGLIYSLFAVFNWSLDSCSDVITSSVVRVLRYVEIILIGSNRGITLYVTLIRAIAVSAKKGPVTPQPMNLRI